jgi:hypothetical protein
VIWNQYLGKWMIQWIMKHILRITQHQAREDYYLNLKNVSVFNVKFFIEGISHFSK